MKIQQVINHSSRTLVEAAEHATQVHRLSTLEPDHAVPVLDAVLCELHLLPQRVLGMFPDLFAGTVTVHVLVVEPAYNTVQPLARLEYQIRPGERDVAVPEAGVFIRELALEQGICERRGDRVEAVLLGMAESVLQVTRVIHVQVYLRLLGHIWGTENLPVKLLTWDVKCVNCKQKSAGKMKKGTIFAKHLPSIKLATRFDAEGREIEVEVREDEESTQKQQEIMDILVSSGYFRAYIKGERLGCVTASGGYF